MMKIKALRNLSEYDIDLQKVVQYKHSNDAGIDLVTCETVFLPASGLQHVTVPSGIAIELPSNYYAQILPRSGQASTGGLHVLGGVIDNGYRGELLITLINLGRHSISFPVGARVAQLVVLPYYKAELEWMEEFEHFTQTDRGKDGHGSTGT
jgi:dUTP pyrophosphatase